MNTINYKLNNNFYIFTGGPGTGKTSVLEALKNKGYVIVPEIARALIKEQNKINGDALPWKNKELYKNIMFNRSIKSYELFDKKSPQEHPVFFDRGFLDTLCYATLIDSEISEEMKTYAKKWRYNRYVFILPPWRDIYETDSERTQDWNEALLTFKKMKETYSNYGYITIEVPKQTIKERAEFILNSITQLNGSR